MSHQEEHRLFADLHFLIQAAFLGQIAYLLHVGLGELVALEEHTAAVGRRDVVDDAYKRGLSGTVGAQQTVDLSLRDIQRHIVERKV